MSPDTLYRRAWVYAGIVVFTALLLLPFLGAVNLFDSDETNYAESAREMIITGDYLTVQIDYEPFPEKPPLFFWLQVLSMKLFGINEFAARFPNLICGILSMVMLYYLGRHLYGQRFGILWILSYGSAILPFFFFKSGIIDPWFNLFIFMGIARFIFYLDPVREQTRVPNLIFSALFFGLATLTKGPVAILIFLLCFLIFLIMRRFRISTSAAHVVLFTLVLSLVGGSWYLFQAIHGNTNLIRDFISYQFQLFSSGGSAHDGFFGYHVVVLLLGVFPASVIAMKSMTKKSESTELQRLFRQWMYVLLGVVIVLFSLVHTKLLHYSSLAYFPMTFLAAWVWEKWIDRKIEISAWQVGLIYLIALFFASMAIFFPLVTNHYDWLISKDFKFLGVFTRAALQRDVHWSGYEWFIGLFLILGVTIAAVQILRRDRRGMLILHLVVLMYVFASLIVFTERVENYSQRVAVKFYQSLKGQDVYVNALGFKSFAQLFYFEKPPSSEDDSLEHLMHDELQKDAYFVLKVNKKESYLERYPELEVILEKDGYVFAVRRAAPSGP
jgi:4-amino-4-deoxy-L-arabinose transferase-like glycosyltransferase